MSALISPEYRQLNEQLHTDRVDYGEHGSQWASMVMELSSQFRTTDILDYGCGKGRLSHGLPFPIHQYDPAIEKYSKHPDPADIVICTDVLEHIEPDYLEAVFDDLQRVTKQIAFIVVATRPAKKHLADGRNAHLIIQPIEWWLPRLMNRFQMVNANNDPGNAFRFLGAHR